MSRAPAATCSLFALVSALVGAVALPGAAAGEELLSLSAAVERALGRYPSVAAARSRVDEAAEALGEAEASRGPLLRFGLSALQYDDPMITSPIHSFHPTAIPPFSETLVQGSLSVSYTLFDAGVRRERTRQASAQQAAASAALTATEQATAARVAAAFAGALARREILAAQEARVAALRLELERARLLLAAGKAPEVETLRAEAFLAAADAERIRAATALDSAERDLARLLDAPVEETRAAGLAPCTLPTAAPRPDREALQGRAVAASPVVEQARRQVEAAEASRALARAAYFPKLDLVGAVQEFREDDLVFATDLNAGFSLVVPIWDGGLTDRRVARAAAQRTTAAGTLAQAELDAREAVDRALAALADADSRAAALARAADRLAEVARVQKLLLEVGSGTQVDYLAAEAELAVTRASTAEARAAALLSRVEIARATGELTPDWLRRTLEAAP